MITITKPFRRIGRRRCKTRLKQKHSEQTKQPYELLK